MRKAKVTLSSLFDRDIGTHLVSDGVQIRGSVPLPLDGHGMGRQCQGRREYHLYMLTAFLGRLQTDSTQGAKSLSVLRDLVKGYGSCSTSYYYSPETVAASLSIVLVEVYCFIIIITCL